jgi:hypothetical protein
MAMSRTVTALVVAAVGWAIVGQAQELVGTVTVDPALSTGRYQGGFGSADLVFDGTLSVSDAGFVQSCNPDEGGVIFEIHGDLGPGPSPCLKPAGRWSSGYGEIKTMAAIDDGRHLLVGQGTTLVVVDLGDPTTMTPVGEIQVPGLVNHVVVDGPFAFVAADEAGVLVVDVSDPEAPALIDVVNTPGRALRIAVSEGLVALADEHGGLRLLDVSDPLRVEERGSLIADRPVRDVSLAGNTAAISGDGIHLVGVNDPAAPVILSYLDIPSFAYEGPGVVLCGEWLLADVSDRIHVYDVSNPSEPVFVRRSGFYMGLKDIETVGSRGIVRTSSDGIAVLDLIDPSAPVDQGWVRHGERITAATIAGTVLVVASVNQLETYWLGVDLNPHLVGMLHLPDWSYNMAASGELAVLAMDQRIAVIDVSNPMSPRVRGLLHLPISRHSAVAVHGSLASVMARDGGLYVVDVSDPSNPSAVGYLPDPQGPNGFWSVVGMGDGFAVVGGETLRVVDLSNPADPRVTSEIAGGVPFVVEGNLVHGAFGDAGLHTLSVEQGQLAEVARLGLGGDATSVAAVGDRAYVLVDHGSDGVRMRVVDVTDPAAPEALGGLEVSGEIIAAFDDIVVIACVGGYYAINTEDGAHPFVERAIATPIQYGLDGGAVGRNLGLFNGSFWILDPRSDSRTADSTLPAVFKRALGEALSGDRVVVADGNLTVIDIADAAQPIEMGAIQTPGFATGVAFESQRLLVADGELGLSVFEIPVEGDVNEATLLATVDVGGEALRVASVDGVAYLTVDEAGLVVVDLADHTVIATLNVGLEGRNEFVRPRAVAVSEDRVYVSYFSSFWEGHYGGLHVYDISSPRRPLFLGMATDSLHEWDLAVGDDVVVGAAYPWGFNVFDVSDPTDPDVIAQIDPISEAHGAAYLGGSRFVFADDLSGVFVADLSDPANPRILRRVQTPGEATGLAVTEDFVYVADGSGGLTVLDRSLCPLPSEDWDGAPLD